MLAESDIRDHHWKLQLKAALRSAQDLAREGFIETSEVKGYDQVIARYPLNLSPYYASLIDKADPACPIRAQAIPRLEELDSSEAHTSDPLLDLEHRPAPRITHRYQGRALLHLTPNCSMNCRYCFRKSLLGEFREQFFDGELNQALDFLKSTDSIHEVILTGGDPLLANEVTLAETLARLGGIAHLKRIRIHSRVPVTLPMRITEAFAERIRPQTLPSVIVMHFNHPKEITPESSMALAHLKTAGHSLLNQSVLLKGVNDNADTLCALSESLFENGVLPYYLHHPDRAKGTQHFDIEPETGVAIHQEMRSRLAGYLVPRYVVDDPRLPYKSDVSGFSCYEWRLRFQ